MLKLLTCPQGHFWEAAADNGEAPAHALCPECGAPAESLPVLDLAPSAPPPAPPPAPKPPVVLLFDADGFPVVTGYEVLESLGRGPTGVAFYRAKQLLVNRQVLLKVVTAKDDPGQLAWGSLRGEASALGRMSHPNVVQVFEAGERERQLFYNAVELVKGPTLAEKVADKPLPIPQVIRLMECLARALDHAHERGVVHRNLKPSSVLLRPVDEEQVKAPHEPAPAGAFCRLHEKVYLPKLTDFGLARKPVDGDITDLDLFGDSPGFLSPEQAWGRAREIGPATDVYGLGGLLYFLLTGRPPFQAPDVTDTLDQVQGAELRPPSALRRGVPADLDAICRKCLYRQPRRRYPTPGALADDLARCAAGLPVRARPAGNAARFGKWVRRRPAGAALLLVCLLSFVGLLVAYFAGRDEGESGKSLTTLRAERDRYQWEAGALRRQAEELRQHRRFVEYRKKLDLARQYLAEKNDPQARTALEQCPDEHRHWEWYYLNQQAHADDPVRLTFDTDVRALAAGAGRAPEPEDGPAVWVPEGAAGFHLAVACDSDDDAPGGKKGVVRLWRLPGKDKVMELTAFDGPVHALALSPDGRHLAVGGGADRDDRDGVVKVWEVGEEPAGRAGPLWSQAVAAGRVTDVTFTSDGAFALAAQANGTLHKWESGDGRPVLGPFGPRGVFAFRPPVTRVAVSADETRVASWYSGDKSVQLFSALNGRPLMNVIGRWDAMAFGGDLLAVAGEDGTVSLYSAGVERQQVLRGHTPPVVRLAFSPDGKRLASASKDTVKVWGRTGEEWVELATLSTPATHGLAFSPTGHALVTAGRREVRVWGAAE
jgi:eukaryotic-like serine/threonine-protein kinase